MVEYRDLYDANKCVTGKTFIKGEQVLKGFLTANKQCKKSYISLYCL